MKTTLEAYLEARQFAQFIADEPLPDYVGLVVTGVGPTATVRATNKGPGDPDGDKLVSDLSGELLASVQALGALNMPNYLGLTYQPPEDGLLITDVMYALNDDETPPWEL